MSDISTSMDFRHSINVRFPNNSDVRHFFQNVSENQTFGFSFQTRKCVWNPNSQKFGFQASSNFRSSDFRHLLLYLFFMAKNATILCERAEYKKMLWLVQHSSIQNKINISITTLRTWIWIKMLCWYPCRMHLLPFIIQISTFSTIYKELHWLDQKKVK